MRIVEIAPLDNGAHRNQSGVSSVPAGWAVIPADMIIPDTFPFVDIEVADSDEESAPFVVSMTAGIVPPPEPETDPEPTPQEDTDAMLVDHELRLTMLELGV